MKSKILNLTLSFAILVGAGGCSSGPRAIPNDPPAEALSGAMQQAAASDPIMELSDYFPDEWWKLFADEQLDGFIQQVFARNPTLQKARANILEASASADKMRASLYPSLFWGGDVSRQKFSETGIIPFGFSQSAGATPGGSGLAVPAGFAGIIPVYFTQTETELNLKYEFDIWGKKRSALFAALGEVQAQVADEAFTRLQLGIALAQVYFQLQIDYRRQEIALALVANREKNFKLIQDRVKGNLNTMQTSQEAQADITVARQTLLQIQGDIAINEYQLKAYLARDFEEAIEEVEIVERPFPKVPVPKDLPLHLVARRPDIIAQLWLIESAGRQIEVARAGFYPDFNLSAFLGYQTIHLHELFFKKSLFYNINPAFTLPIFEGGRLVANLRGSEVNYDMAIYEYNDLVLNAAKEVLQGMAVLSNREQQLAEVRRSLAYQEEIDRLANLRLQYNLNSGLNNLAIEKNVLLARDQEAIAIGNTLQSILALIKALGGGFDVYGGCESE